VEVAMKLTRWFFILCVLPLVHPWVLGQQQEKPVVVSPVIGDTLDAKEREKFQLFPNVKGFEWAVFYFGADSSLVVKACLLDDGVRRDTIIARYRTVSTLTTIRNQIRQLAEGKTARETDHDSQVLDRLRRLAKEAAESKREDKVVILSSRVGSVIDGAERTRYQLFPDIKGFDRAVFLQTPEETYYAKIIFIEPDGARRDTSIQYSEDTLLVLAERIEHFEGLRQKTYQIGEQPAKIRVAETELGYGGGVAGRGQGADVAVILTNGQKIEGELISIRDSSLLIATATGNTIPIRDTNVSRMIVQGNSHVLVGGGVGLLSGLLIGGLVAGMEIESLEREGDVGGAFRWVFGGAGVSVGLGALAGTLVGVGIGAAASQSDIDVSLDVPAERSALKKLARYPDNEPEFLEQVK
jgi:hypothetical protein